MDVVTSYIELGLRLGRHIDGLVDAYYGPSEIAEGVEAEEPQDAAALVSDAGRLLESLDDRSWLQAQVIGLDTVARRLAGEEISYEDEIERCYGIRPERVPEEALEGAHRELDELLPGAGSLAERYQAWREGDAIPGDALAAVIEALAGELRSRTRALFGLPDGEGVEFEFVTDEPWAAFNYYLGGLCSRIAVNTDVAMTPDFVADLVAHEAYPGHHTEHASKEQVQVREAGRLEESIFMVGTPQCLMSEGIAGLGLEILLGDEAEELTAKHVLSTGVAYDVDLSRALKQARRPLLHVGGNAALMLNAGEISMDETREYLMHWGLFSERRAKQALSLAVHPTWRAYVTTYTDGYRVCSDFVAGDPDRFKRLLTEQLTPADLLAAGS